MTRNEFARIAFYGGNEALMNHLNDMDGYTLSGIEWTSNGMTLARAIELVEGLSDEDMNALVAMGVIAEEPRQC